MAHPPAAIVQGAGRLHDTRFESAGSSNPPVQSWSARLGQLVSRMGRPDFNEIVADVLRDSPAEIDEKELTKRALGVGNQYVAQGRVRSTESVSALLFATARQVVADQHLLEPAADLVERRTAFRDELRGILADMDKVEQISLEQFVARVLELAPRGAAA